MLFRSPDVAYARTVDAGTEWNYAVKATPGRSNQFTTYSDKILDAPIFSILGGVFSSQISLELSLPSNSPDNAEIRYTTDGSEPDASSNLYSNPLQINKTTCLKAKVIAPNAITIKATANSYIFHGRQVTLPNVRLLAYYDWLTASWRNT